MSIIFYNENQLGFALGGDGPPDGYDSWDSVPPTTGGLPWSPKRENDGFWCPVCFDRHGRFNWISNADVSQDWKCPGCKVRPSKFNMARVKQIMKNR